MQEFEKTDKLAAHIERMASSGTTGTPSEWSDFLIALNGALAGKEQKPPKDSQ